jgi:hypothetical protein
MIKGARKKRGGAVLEVEMKMRRTERAMAGLGGCEDGGRK